MKNLLLLAIGAAAAFYAYTSWRPSADDMVSASPASGRSYGSNPVREIQRAPNALIDMQGAMGNANAGAANAARRAAIDTLGR